MENHSVAQVMFDRSKLTVAPGQTQEIVLTVSFAYVAVWRDVIELRLVDAATARHCVPIVAKSMAPNKIDIAKLDIGARLGGGSFASVHKVKEK